MSEFGGEGFDPIRAGYGTDFDMERGEEQSEDVRAALEEFRSDWETNQNETQINSVFDKILKLKKDDLILKNIRQLDTTIRGAASEGEYAGQFYDEEEKLVHDILVGFKPQSSDKKGVVEAEDSFDESSEEDDEYDMPKAA